ncbi:hypothetical protein LI328DRAFT_158218 [Trichoderma asperelloides]|nr:hypothetical protein LI328DRAFT_158218 [Trichoderma asperelloides]
MTTVLHISTSQASLSCASLTRTSANPPLASATPHMASPQQRAPSAYMTLRPTSGLVAPLTFLKRRGDPAAVLLASLTSA